MLAKVASTWRQGSSWRHRGFGGPHNCWSKDNGGRTARRTSSIHCNGETCPSAQPHSPCIEVLGRKFSSDPWIRCLSDFPDVQGSCTWPTGEGRRSDRTKPSVSRSAHIGLRKAETVSVYCRVQRSPLEPTSGVGCDMILSQTWAAFWDWDTGYLLVQIARAWPAYSDFRSWPKNRPYLSVCALNCP